MREKITGVTDTLDRFPVELIWISIKKNLPQIILFPWLPWLAYMQALCNFIWLACLSLLACLWGLTWHAVCLHGSKKAKRRKDLFQGRFLPLWNDYNFPHDSEKDSFSIAKAVVFKLVWNLCKKTSTYKNKV